MGWVRFRRKSTARKPEDRDRLVANPIVMSALAEGDPDFVDYLTFVRARAPTLLAFDPHADRENIHLWTAGIKRKVVSLVAAGIKIAKNDGPDTKVDATVLLRAYQSSTYTSHRLDVEVLMRQAITKKMERSNLWNPFPAVDEGAPSTLTSNVTEAKALTEKFEKRIEETALRSAMTPAERGALEEVEKASGAVPAALPATVVKSRRQKATKESLLAALALVHPAKS